MKNELIKSVNEVKQKYHIIFILWMYKIYGLQFKEKLYSNAANKQKIY